MFNVSSHLSLVAGILLVLVCSNRPVNGQIQLNQGSLERAGLNALWFTSAELGAGGRIVDWAFNVNRAQSTAYIRLEAGAFREIISERDLDGFGKPLGLDGLVEFAEFRKQIVDAELKSRHRGDGAPPEIKLEQYTLPQSTIYILGSNARITAIDADSGRQNWSVAFGSLGQPNIGIHADDNYVAAVNGTTLYCFEAATGKTIWSHACKFAVEAPPVVAGGKIFVPLLDGRLEVFDISKEGFGGQAIVATGVPSSRPLVATRTIGWATDVGYLNFTAIEGEMGNSLIYRLKTGGRISNTPTFRDELIFAGCEDGFVYAIREATGQLEWQLSLGTPVSQSPFTFQDRLYVVTDDRRMYCIDARTGEMKWDEPMTGIGRYLGASRERIYLTDGFRSLLVVDPIGGKVISRADVGGVRSILPNNETDRLYVASNAGVIHCIHETGSQIPYFHSDKLEAALAGKPASKPAEDPFKVDEDSAEDPFQSDASDGSDKPKDADDPFAMQSGDGGQSEPAESDDPFASGDNQPQPADDEKDAENAKAAPAKKTVVWKDVARVFSNNCAKCHNAENPKGEFDASSYEGVMSRGEELIEAGDGAASHLYQIVNHEAEPAMPPGDKKLSNADLKKIKAWIDAGALETQPAADEEEADDSDEPAEGGDPFASGNDGGDQPAVDDDGASGSDDNDPFK